MASWLFKSAVHRILSLMPASRWLNELFQTHISHSLDFGQEQLRDRLNHCHLFLEHLRKNDINAKGLHILELGTGWYPILPLGFYLSGADEIWTFDIKPLLKSARLLNLIRLIREADTDGSLHKMLPEVQPARVTDLLRAEKDSANTPPDQILERFGIHLLVGDARSTGLLPETIDLFFSYSVLEYISSSGLIELYKEFARIATSNAISIHYVNCGDQYSIFDKTITPYNFMRFTKYQWRWLNSALNPLTRMR